MATNSAPGTHQAGSGRQRFRKLTRAKTPKTKGGCVTCKARHVKCDEARPACRRCLQFWGKCDGYSPPQSRPRAIKTIAPKCTKPLLPQLHTGKQIVLIKELSIHGFRDENENRFFGIFRTETVEGLPGFLKTDLWERLILQACWDEEFVRDAAVAIGALSSRSRSLVVDQTNPEQLIGTSSYRFALQHYGQALKKMRATISNSSAHLRKALVGCLLVICFECLQGNYTQALAHAVSGTQLLQTWLETQSPSLSSPEDYKRREGMVSPNRHVIEDELVQAFGRLDLQVMAFVDPRPPSIHDQLMHTGALTILHMPANFTSVDQARLYWDVVQRRSSHFIASTAAKSMKTGTYVPTTNVDLGIGESTLIYHPESEVFTGKELPPEYEKYAGEIARWFSAFTPFYESLRAEKGAEQWSYTAMSLLYIHAKTSEIMLLNSLSRDENFLDRFLPEYKEVVELADEIMNSPFFETGSFKFDLGIVNPLRLVAKWCREGHTRRRALKLLRDGKVREGLYDGLNMATSQGWVMQLEEEGMDEQGRIPEEMRWRITSVKLDCLGGRVQLEAERFGRGISGERVVRGAAITWGGMV